MNIDLSDLTQVQSLFPVLSNIHIVGAKGPQVRYSAIYTPTGQEVYLYVTPSADAMLFGWTNQYITKAQSAIHVNHFGLIKLLEIDQKPDLIYLIFENPSSIRLEDFSSYPHVPAKIALQQVRNMALGVEKLHIQHLFHGAICPKSILMDSTGEHAKLIPINIHPNRDISELGPFASPEQLAFPNQPATAATDIYALGVLLYILLTGKTPEETHFAMPSRWCSCSAKVDALVAKATSPNPTERFSNVTELIDAIEVALPTAETAAPASVLSTPPAAAGNTLTSLPKPATKQSSWTWIIVACLLLGVAGGVYYLTGPKEFGLNSKSLEKVTAKIGEASKDIKSTILSENSSNDKPIAPTPEPIVSIEKPSEKPVIDTTTPTPVQPQNPTVVAPNKEPGINWMLAPETKIKLSSVRDPKEEFDIAKLSDGNINPKPEAKSVTCSQIVVGKPGWLGIDFGASTNRIIDRIIIYSLGDAAELGHMTTLSIELLDNEKNLLEEHQFTSATGNQLNRLVWKLNEPEKVRAILIKSKDEACPLIVSEVEVYGPEESAQDSDDSSETEDDGGFI